MVETNVQQVFKQPLSLLHLLEIVVYPPLPHD